MHEAALGGKRRQATQQRTTAVLAVLAAAFAGGIFTALMSIVLAALVGANRRGICVTLLTTLFLLLDGIIGAFAHDLHARLLMPSRPSGTTGAPTTVLFWRPRRAVG